MLIERIVRYAYYFMTILWLRPYLSTQEMILKMDLININENINECVWKVLKTSQNIMLI